MSFFPQELYHPPRTVQAGGVTVQSLTSQGTVQTVSRLDGA